MFVCVSVCVNERTYVVAALKEWGLISCSAQCICCFPASLYSGNIVVFPKNTIIY